MDAFAVAVATGLALPRVTARHTFRIAFHFGLFQFLMPVIGWLAGAGIAKWIEHWDHWLAMGLLAFVGGKMLYEAWTEEEGTESAKADPTRGWSLVLLSVATSLDALAIGFSMALVPDSTSAAGPGSIWLPAVVIGLVACTLSAIGILFGSRIGPRWGRWAETAGGSMLVLIGLKILIEHLGGFA